jgi:hypothetical protein
MMKLSVLSETHQLINLYFNMVTWAVSRLTGYLTILYE